MTDVNDIFGYKVYKPPPEKDLPIIEDLNCYGEIVTLIDPNADVIQDPAVQKILKSLDGERTVKIEDLPPDVRYDGWNKKAHYDNNVITAPNRPNGAVQPQLPTVNQNLLKSNESVDFQQEDLRQAQLKAQNVHSSQMEFSRQLQETRLALEKEIHRQLVENLLIRAQRKSVTPEQQALIEKLYLDLRLINPELAFATLKASTQFPSEPADLEEFLREFQVLSTGSEHDMTASQASHSQPSGKVVIGPLPPEKPSQRPIVGPLPPSRPDAAFVPQTPPLPSPAVRQVIPQSSQQVIIQVEQPQNSSDPNQKPQQFVIEVQPKVEVNTLTPNAHSQKSDASPSQKPSSKPQQRLPPPSPREAQPTKPSTTKQSTPQASPRNHHRGQPQPEQHATKARPAHKFQAPPVIPNRNAVLKQHVYQPLKQPQLLSNQGSILYDAHHQYQQQQQQQAYLAAAQPPQYAQHYKPAPPQPAVYQNSPYYAPGAYQHQYAAPSYQPTPAAYNTRYNGAYGPTASPAAPNYKPFVPQHHKY